MDAVNNQCGTTPCKVFPSGDRLAEEFDKLVYHQDEPFAGASVYSQWCVMRAARENGVPVLLDGQGGDEALCGYKKYALFYLKSLLRQRRFMAAARHGWQTLCNGDRQLLDLRQGTRYLPSFLRGQHRLLDLVDRYAALSRR